MPRNGSGTYTLPAGQPVVSGSTISSSVHNNLANDLATALTDSVDKDGQTVITGNIDFNGNQLIIDVDGDTYVDSTTDDQIDFTIGNVLSLSLTAARAAALEDISDLTPGDIALLDVAQEWTARQNFNQVALTSTSNAVAWDAATSQVAQHTLTENTTVGAATNAPAGSFLWLNVVQGSGPYTLAWNAAYKGTIPTMPTDDLHQMAFMFFTPDGTNFHYCGGTEEIQN